MKPTRTWVALALVCWTVAAVAYAVLARATAGTTVVLVALGPLVAGLVQTHRQHRTVLTRLDRQTALLDRQTAILESHAVRADQRVARVGEHVEGLADLGPSLATDLDALRTTMDALPHREEFDAKFRAAAADIITRTRKGVAVDLLLTFRQLEALHNLYALGGVDRPMPPTRGWASSPDLLLLLATLVEREEPSLVVECGSGTSTLWLAMLLRRFEIKGRVVSLEHHEPFVEAAWATVLRHDLAEYVEVRYAPLESFEFDGTTYQWYSRQAWEELDGIGLLFVDGPPGELGRHARFPAFPLLVDKLAPDAVVVLDDLIRPDEQEVLERWLAARPDYHAERVSLEKNAALLRRPRRPGHGSHVPGTG
ncbi:Methyltransferase domain-containing protein [Actinopolymorpha cephalotaxi]|uniref:Methyltransferase domain-containing protein n=1 Tax=Actinopolymorpha cephalotaxi TaxID=504797 RepID=A0A1I2ZDH0_9ACTN|nr:class I SAM-dependent methyltransferase [Actinopolymorpha cephalotaxi]NYH81914.1 putative O-methyltransferase YrrM [Actinopolymorpha cephalotaxi]SFH35606.1 Methyltransferase domain-containing protein [Actinopolymorpha cephalotaxi]